MDSIKMRDEMGFVSSVPIRSLQYYKLRLKYVVRQLKELTQELKELEQIIKIMEKEK